MILQIISFWLCATFSLAERPAPLWLEAKRYFLSRGDTAHIEIKTGENFAGAPQSSIPPINDVFHRSVSSKQVLKPPEENAESIPIRLLQPGTHHILLNSEPVPVKLDPTAFTAWLQDEGLDDIISHRRKSETSEDEASLSVSWHSKLLLQCGPGNQPSSIVSSPLEIVLEQDPASLRKGSPISFKLMFENKPVFGAKVKVWNRYQRRTSVQNIFSQQDGRIETHVSNPGEWMVSVVKMIPDKEDKVDYRVYMGSLVFGVR